MTSGGTPLVSEQPDSGRRLNLPRLCAWLALVLALAAANFSVYFISPSPTGKTSIPSAFRYELALSGVFSYAILLGLMLLIARHLPWREIFALRKPRSWWKSLELGFGLLVAMLFCSAIVEALFHPGRAQGVTPDHWVSGHTLAFVLNLLVVAGLAPIIEEALFRGLGYWLFAPLGATITLGANGVLFGLAHGLLSGLILLIPFGIGLAWIRRRSESLYPCVILHAGFNALSMLAIFL